MIEMRIGHLEKLEYQVAEAMNTLCANLSIAGGDIRKILVTSSTPREGKSFISINLMRSMSKLGLKVVLVDADMRASTLQDAYDIQIVSGDGNYPGLCGYLSGHCELNAVIGKTDIPGSHLILAGKLIANPFPLFNSPRLKNLLDDLTTKFDVVLIDAPPIGTVIDAVKIAEHCDGALFIVESGAISVNDLKSAAAQIEKTGCPIMGYVINKANTSDNKMKYYSYYSSAPRRKKKNSL